MYNYQATKRKYVLFVFKKCILTIHPLILLLFICSDLILYSQKLLNKAVRYAIEVEGLNCNLGDDHTLFLAALNDDHDIGYVALFNEEYEDGELHQEVIRIKLPGTDVEGNPIVKEINLPALASRQPGFFGISILDSVMDRNRRWDAAGFKNVRLNFSNVLDDC